MFLLIKVELAKLRMQKLEQGFPLLRLSKELEGRAQNSPSMRYSSNLNSFGAQNSVMIF
jgi:hypothetical protein